MHRKSGILLNAIYGAKVNSNEKSSTTDSVKEIGLTGLVNSSCDEDDDGAAKLALLMKNSKRKFVATWNKSDSSESEKADMCLQGNITDSDDGEPSEVSKLTHSELLTYFHEVNGCFERLREKYAKLESQKVALIELNEQLDQLVKTYQSRIPKCDKCPTFEEEIKKLEIKIKSLENEILILKESENTRIENSIKKCI